jgi:Uma2 family endonuclease
MLSWARQLGAAVNVAVVDPAPDLPPRRAFSVQDIRRMLDAGVLSEDENIELVEGEIVVMAAKDYAHEIIKTALVKTFIQAAPAELSIGVEMTIQFSAESLLEPDIAVIPTSKLLKSDASFVSVEHGGCSLAVEVAASSLGYDRGRKALQYARFGVQEFWVVDAKERVTWIHTGPSGDGWSSIVKHNPSETLTTQVLPRLTIRLSDV